MANYSTMLWRNFTSRSYGGNPLALSVSQRAYILENGHLVYSGSAEELVGNREVRQKYLGI